MSDSYTVTFLKGEFLPITRPRSDYLVSYLFVPTKFIGEPEQESETKSGTVLVGITHTLQSIWGLQDDNLTKVLFEYAKRRVKEKAEEKSLGGESQIELNTYNSSGTCPYNPERIKFNFQEPIRIDVPEENPVTSGEPATVPSQIKGIMEKYEGKRIKADNDAQLEQFFVFKGKLHPIDMGAAKVCERREPIQYLEAEEDFILRRATKGGALTTHYMRETLGTLLLRLRNN